MLKNQSLIVLVLSLLYCPKPVSGSQAIGVSHAEFISESHESLKQVQMDSHADEVLQIEEFSTSEDDEPIESSKNSATISNPLTAPKEKDEASTFESRNQAKLIALNKITAKSKELTLKIGQPQYFGNIEITVHKCLKKLDLYAPDNNILLTVVEKNVDEEATTVFQGWMLSSSIAVSTFEHPVYEILAKDCL